MKRYCCLICILTLLLTGCGAQETMQLYVSCTPATLKNHEGETLGILQLEGDLPAELYEPEIVAQERITLEIPYSESLTYTPERGNVNLRVSKLGGGWSVDGSGIKALELWDTGLRAAEDGEDAYISASWSVEEEFWERSFSVSADGTAAAESWVEGEIWTVRVEQSGVSLHYYDDLGYFTIIFKICQGTIQVDFSQYREDGTVTFYREGEEPMTKTVWKKGE